MPEYDSFRDPDWIAKYMDMNWTNRKKENTVPKKMVYTPEEEAAKNSEAYYQATQDIGRGGMNPNEAFSRRGFVKNNRGNWVFKK